MARCGCASLPSGPLQRSLPPSCAERGPIRNDLLTLRPPFCLSISLPPDASVSSTSISMAHSDLSLSLHPPTFLFLCPRRGLRGDPGAQVGSWQKPLKLEEQRATHYDSWVLSPRGSAKLCPLPPLVGPPGRLLVAPGCIYHPQLPTHGCVGLDLLCVTSALFCWELLRAGLCLPHQRRPLPLSDPPSLPPSCFTGSPLGPLGLSFHFPGPWTWGPVLAAGQCRAAGGCFSRHSGERTPAGQRASWEEVTLGEWCFFWLFRKLRKCGFV